ncbi:hypothetical protein Tco_0087559 [Tanacetum coccineum]
MALSIADQIALDDALVAPADRIKIGIMQSSLCHLDDHLRWNQQMSQRILHHLTVLRLSQASRYCGVIRSKGIAMYLSSVHLVSRQLVMEKDPSIPRRTRSIAYCQDDPMFYYNLCYSKDEPLCCTGAILPVGINQRGHSATQNPSIEYYAMASRNNSSLKQKRTEQLKIVTKKKPSRNYSSHDSGYSSRREGTGITPGVPDAPDYDSEDDISWKSSDDDQEDDEQAEDDEDAADDDDDDEHDDNKKAQDDDDEELTESDNDGDDFVHPKLTTHDYKNDVNETTQDDEDDDEHDDDEKAQDDDDEEQTESEDDGDDFIHPKLTTHDDDIIHEEETDEDDTFDPIVHTPSRISSSDEEDITPGSSNPGN